MSCDVKASGTLRFDSVEDLEDADESLDDDDVSVADVREVIKHGVVRSRTTVTIDIDANLTADANVIFQDWLEDVATAAVAGHIETWQDSFGDSMYVRVHAGGEEESIAKPYPATARPVVKSKKPATAKKKATAKKSKRSKP